LLLPSYAEIPDLWKLVWDPRTGSSGLALRARKRNDIERRIRMNVEYESDGTINFTGMG
jgi:hypothetical protein